jgi:hypothetical protein
MESIRTAHGYHGALRGWVTYIGETWRAQVTTDGFALVTSYHKTEAEALAVLDLYFGQLGA